MPFNRTSGWTVESIHALILEGKTMKAIADHFGLTRQRIKQICERYSLPSTIKTRKAIRAEKYFKKWGTREKTDLYSVCRDKFRAKKYAAQRAGVEWAIEFGELEWPATCPVLGLELDYFAERTQENSPSFDRIDPDQGYVSGNVRIMSWRANRIKNDGTADEHRLIAAYLDKCGGSTGPER